MADGYKWWENYPDAASPEGQALARARGGWDDNHPVVGRTWDAPAAALMADEWDEFPDADRYASAKKRPDPPSPRVPVPNDEFRAYQGPGYGHPESGEPTLVYGPSPDEGKQTGYSVDEKTGKVVLHIGGMKFPPIDTPEGRVPIQDPGRAQVRAGEGGLPYVPPLPGSRPEMRSYEPTSLDKTRDVLRSSGLVPEDRIEATAQAIDAAGQFFPGTVAYKGGRMVGEGIHEGSPGEVAAGGLIAASPLIGGPVLRGLSAVGQPAARAIESAVTAAPKTSAALGATALLAGSAGAANAPSTAQEASPSASQPSLFDQLTGGAGTKASKFFNQDDDFTPIDRETFFSARRTQRQSLEDAQRQASDQVMNSQEYKDLVSANKRTAANALVNQAMTRAKTRWAESQATIPQEEARLQKDYSDYIKDMNDRRDKYYNKSWQDRSPMFSKMVGIASYILPIVLARKGFNKIAQEGQDLIAQAQRARAAYNVRNEAAALIALDRWGRTATGKYAWTALKASAIPAEVRMGGEAWDKYFLPEGSGAQTRATEKIHKIFSSVSGAATELSPSILAGLATAALGSFVSKSAPRNAAAGC